jgi:hypothetical protein
MSKEMSQSGFLSRDGSDRKGVSEEMMQSGSESVMGVSQ